MAITGIRIGGTRELRRRLSEIEGGLDDLKAANRRVADYVLSASRPHTPFRTGRLAATLRAGATRSRAVIRAGNARVPYAAPIHFGWPRRHIAAQPWVIDAAQRTEPAWAARYQAEINDLVERTSAQ